MVLNAYSIEKASEIPHKQGLYAFYLDITSPIKIGLIGQGPFEKEKLERAKKILIRKINKLLEMLRFSSLDGYIREVGRGEHIAKAYRVKLSEYYSGSLMEVLEGIPSESILEFSKMSAMLPLFSQPIYIGITKTQTLYGRYKQHKYDFEKGVDNSKFGVRLKNQGLDWDDLLFGCVEFDSSSDNIDLLNILEKQLQSISNPILSVR